MSKQLWRSGMLVLTLAFISACSSDNTSPTAFKPSSASGDLLGGLTSTLGSTLQLTSVVTVQRTTPLAAPITISQTIGTSGGVLSIPAAGVTVIVPAGALTQPTVITMTARAGSMLAYDFEPHGVVFAKPLVFNQSLRGTTASILSAPLLRLGYYADASLLGQTTALVSDVIGGAVNALSWSFTAPIKHFSGYVVICGRSGSDVE